MTLTNSSMDLTLTMSEKAAMTKSNQYIANQRRQSLRMLNNRRLSSLLLDTMNECVQTIQNMEDEILLPIRLKDMSIDELIFDNSNQPDNWHEIYTFVRQMKNQLQCIYPFADDDSENGSRQSKSDSDEKQRKYSNDDEGITMLEGSSSTSSVASSEEYEQNSTTSSVPTSFETIKDELKYHYYGLFQSLNGLTLMANRVRDRYREESN
ncbi:unnamed protein product [Adineta ricciae]|uniref:Uncharacterized protein n=1 Tax=Adineta ricciae TaxID=249248 RepID=A0A814XZJ8_ADIRI|nr:unnamed protein product [Adineta ricciae]CAF1223001.1 unnamed protein product [Adineta ricciae]